MTFDRPSRPLHCDERALFTAGGQDASLKNHPWAIPSSYENIQPYAVRVSHQASHNALKLYMDDLLFSPASFSHEASESSQRNCSPARMLSGACKSSSGLPGSHARLRTERGRELALIAHAIHGQRYFQTPFISLASDLEVASVRALRDENTKRKVASSRQHDDKKDILISIINLRHRARKGRVLLNAISEFEDHCGEPLENRLIPHMQGELLILWDIEPDDIVFTMTLEEMRLKAAELILLQPPSNKVIDKLPPSSALDDPLGCAITRELLQTNYIDSKVHQHEIESLHRFYQVTVVNDLIARFANSAQGSEVKQSNRLIVKFQKSARGSGVKLSTRSTTRKKSVLPKCLRPKNINLTRAKWWLPNERKCHHAIRRDNTQPSDHMVQKVSAMKEALSKFLEIRSATNVLVADQKEVEANTSNSGGEREGSKGSLFPSEGDNNGATKFEQSEEQRETDAIEPIDSMGLKHGGGPVDQFDEPPVKRQETLQETNDGLSEILIVDS